MRNFIQNRGGGILLVLTLLANGCISEHSQHLIVKAEKDFHKDFNEMRYADIYESSSAQFKQASSQDSFIALMRVIRQHLGEFKSGSQQTVGTKTNNFKTFLIVSYSSTFERGSAVETFTLTIENNKAIICGYNVVPKDANQPLEQR